MRKIALLLLLLTIGVASICSCGKKDDAPEGLQTADVRAQEGYIFYAPEHWSVINSESVSAAKVSAINNTSITFTEAASPEGTLPEYFDASCEQFPDSIKSDLKILLRDEKCNFGNANGDCLKYVYTYKYQGYDFTCMQILVINGAKFYIFTYTSYGTADDEYSDYRKYLDAVQLSVDNFKFTESTSDSDSVTYPKDAEGFNLVSDKAISGFELFLPDSYSVLYSDAYIKAKITSGANLSLSKATSTGVSISDYWKIRKEKLSSFVTNIEEIEVNKVNEAPTETNPAPESTVVFGNIDPVKVASYEYKYDFNGKTYHVYQVMGVDGFNGYVFTYTALEDEYSQHIDDIKTILEKVRF